ncbi:MAG: tetratricopeptide repeat protein [Bacteroidota bacterium]
MFSHAQSSIDAQLAKQFYDQKEYEKAIKYYENLYDKIPDAYFANYYKCLIETKDYSKAEKVIKKQIKKNSSNTYLYVQLGKVYRLQGHLDKEKEQYNKSIKEVIPEQNTIFTLAHAFEEEQLFDYAIEVYKKGRKQSANTYPYYYEMADLYKKKGDLKAMVNEYLDAIEFRESELYTAQANLQQSLGYDEKNGGFNNPILKQELQKRIQQAPDKIIFSEFLIFLQTQQKDFEGAFIQSKAIDKRQKEDGTRIIDLAKLCVSNENYTVAEKCFQYIISKGKDNGYYDYAILERLNVKYILLTTQSNVQMNEFILLNSEIEAVLTKYGLSNLSLPVLKKSALLKAYYLNQPNEAIELLENAITKYSFDKNAVAEIKLDLGDMHLLVGDIWDASLLYSQVEKDFKYEIVGQNAKFRNAKLSYYASDFKWAKSQCDVLKGSTSKTIANDALDLSLLITDAIGIDTNDAPLKMFAAADLLILQHQYQKALLKLDSINNIFAEHTLGDDIYYKKADIFMLTQRYSEAVKMYENIVEYYPNELYGDDALYKQAELYDRFLLNQEKAKTLYQEFLDKYPGSIYVIEARKRFRELRGDFVN